MEGIILSRRNIGEADRLLNIFTKEKGKIKVVARGARRIKSKLACQIEPFAHGDFQVIEGKTFYILTGAEATCTYLDSHRDIDLYRSISYIHEITDISYQEEEPNTDLYQVLGQLTKEMVRSGNTGPLVAYFEIKLLSSLGYRPNYTICRKCQKPITERAEYAGDYEGVFCGNCGKGKLITKNTLKLLRYMSDAKIEDIVRLNIEAEELSGLEEIIRSFLQDVLPRSPKSLQI